MTAQIGEELHYEGRVVTMYSEPLGDYFVLGGARPEFDFNCTALWRGYVGTWEIREGREVGVKEVEERIVSYLPDTAGPVAAESTRGR